MSSSVRFKSPPQITYFTCVKGRSCPFRRYGLMMGLLGYSDFRRLSERDSSTRQTGR